MAPKIVVANRVHEDVTTLLAAYGSLERNWDAEPWSRAELIRRCQDATALMAFMTESVDEDFLAACPNLRMIACALKGYDNFDLAACRRHGVTVSIVPDLLIAPTAELTIGLIIALGRHILSSDRYVRGGAFQGWRPTFYGSGLDGSVVGIVGMGAVGQAIAARLAGFGCAILYHDTKPLAPDSEARLAARRVPLDDLLAASDTVVVVLPLTAGAIHLIGQAAIGRMKQGALLVNTGRGSIVDEQAVADALIAGHLGGYAADVYAMEDWARPDRPRAIPAGLLAETGRTVLTSHIGSAVDRVRREIAMQAARNIIEFLSGRRPAGTVTED